MKNLIILALFVALLAACSSEKTEEVTEETTEQTEQTQEAAAEETQTDAGFEGFYVKFHEAFKSEGQDITGFVHFPVLMLAADKSEGIAQDKFMESPMFESLKANEKFAALTAADFTKGTFVMADITNDAEKALIEETGVFTDGMEVYTADLEDKTYYFGKVGEEYKLLACKAK